MIIKCINSEMNKSCNVVDILRNRLMETIPKNIHNICFYQSVIELFSKCQFLSGFVESIAGEHHRNQDSYRLLMMPPQRVSD